GKSVIGIEVPNAVTSLVTVRGVIESAAFQKLQTKCKLAVGLGKATGGEVVVADIAKMPHLLIAGATGSGKTACMNSIIGCLLMQNTPDELRLILIDPKRVELTTFSNIPHLLSPVVVDVEEAVKALRRVIVEMDNRYKKFAAVSVRNIEGYNKSARVPAPLPNLVVVIDELADLMMTAPDVVELSLCRLAQLARATGIHLIVATQRPSVDVVTGLIKANFPTRISFAVTSQVDSRTILDMVGAEKLLGRGDMLYMPTDAAKPRRLQGTFSSDPEMEKIVNYWVCQQPAAAASDDFATAFAAIDGDAPDEKDPVLAKARQLAKDGTRLSASLLQRRLRIGYPRAARIMDVLREEGLVDGEVEEWEGDSGPENEGESR
ncbi:MAG: DNA translocase FtsK, partial [Dehalococcoidia bacterium]|nr:DNA translocase FtsK [Dehalococcoidia bacterium]